VAIAHQQNTPNEQNTPNAPKYAYFLVLPYLATIRGPNAPQNKIINSMLDLPLVLMQIATNKFTGREK
jgi:hypothetical protein